MNIYKSYFLLVVLLSLLHLCSCSVDAEDREILNLKAIDLNQDDEITLDEFDNFIRHLPILKEHY
jgi:hypothetical protein